MLVLSRRVGEAIVIDGPARVTVTSLSGLKVRLGVEAGPNVQVLREELDHEGTADRGRREGSGRSLFSPTDRLHVVHDVR